MWLTLMNYLLTFMLIYSYSQMYFLLNLHKDCIQCLKMLPRSLLPHFLWKYLYNLIHLILSLCYHIGIILCDINYYFEKKAPFFFLSHPYRIYISTVLIVWKCCHGHQHHLNQKYQHYVLPVKYDTTQRIQCNMTYLGDSTIHYTK